MRKGKLLFFCLGAGLVLAAVVWAISRDREPTYDGRTLSKWIELAGRENTEAREAIRRMGTNTFPVILKWLCYKPAPWKTKVLNRLGLGPDWVRPHFLVSWLNDEQAVTRVMHAYNMLGVLQEEAAPIGPEILRLSYDKSDVGILALEALGVMQITGLPHLLRAVRDRHHPHRKEAVRSLRMVLHNPAATNAIQALFECTEDMDSEVEHEASVCLAVWSSQEHAGAMIDTLKRTVGSTNQAFLRVLRNLEMRAANGIANDSLTR